jgi:hypothetical protein
VARGLCKTPKLRCLLQSGSACDAIVGAECTFPFIDSADEISALAISEALDVDVLHALDDDPCHHAFRAEIAQLE